MTFMQSQNSKAEIKHRLDRTDSTEEAATLVAMHEAQERLDNLKEYDARVITDAMIDLFGYSEDDFEDAYLEGRPRKSWGEVVDMLTADQQRQVLAYLK